MFIIWVMLAFLVLYIGMAVRGPSMWDRLLGMTLASTKIILIVLLLASIQGMTFLLDYAIIYALCGFIGTLFIALFWGAKQEKRGGE